MRCDAALAKLTEEQQADLFDWLTNDTYAAVLKRIAQRPRRGFGIKTHINSLQRFYEQRQAQIRARDLANLKSSGEAPDEPPTTPAQWFCTAADGALAHSTYTLANSPVTPVMYRALTHELITAAERPNTGVICEHDWSEEAITLLSRPLAGAPGRKTYRQWVEQADDPEEMVRHILMNVCNGSEKWEMLQNSDYEFTLDERWVLRAEFFFRKAWKGAVFGITRRRGDAQQTKRKGLRTATVQTKSPDP